VGHWVKLHRGSTPVWVNLDLVRFIEPVASPEERAGSRIFFRHVSHISGVEMDEYIQVKESADSVLLLAGDRDA
jgi:hypothetical protein